MHHVNILELAIPNIVPMTWVRDKEIQGILKTFLGNSNDRISDLIDSETNNYLFDYLHKLQC